MFQHKIKESVQYKELCIVRHILCVKSIYFDLHGPVGVCSGDNFFFSEIWRRRILPVFAKFLVLQFP